MTTDRITKATAAVEQARALYERASTAAENATPGGRTGYDPAILSGIRRKPNHKADRARWSAYDREAEAYHRLEKAEAELARARAVEARAERDAAAPRDIPGLRVGDLVRTGSGWHRVARVNAKSVSVETGYSWTDRVTHDQIIETRRPAS